METKRMETEKVEKEQTLLEQMREIIIRNPFATYIGIELLEAEQGKIRARIHLEPKFENIYGGMHGGCAYSLADTIAGMAAASYGNLVTTLHASVDYMLPVSNTEYLYCEANVQRHGGKISVVRAEFTNDDGKLLISSSFTFYHLAQKLEYMTTASVNKTH